MSKFYDKVKDVLSQNDSYISEDGDLLRNAIYEDCMKMDVNFIKLLLSDEDIKKEYFINIDDVLVFDKIKFSWLINNHEFLPNSYTRFKNKIGLVNSKNEFISDIKDVSLVFPYKDCFLEGGQTKDEQKREEIFYNEILAPDEIDRLLYPKVFTNMKRYTKDGVESIIEFDEKDNLIIKGNNLLALSSILEKYKGKVKCIYIDPPYNTGSDSFKYNDNFNHSSWLTFMKNRLSIAKSLLSDEGVIFISIDDSEVAYSTILLNEIFGKENYIATLPTITNLKGNQDQFGFAGTHEYILVFAKERNKVKLYNFNLDEDEILNNWKEDEIGYYKKGAILRSTGEESLREDRPKMFYPILIKNGKIESITIEEYNNIYSQKENQFNDIYLKVLIDKYEKDGYIVILPFKDKNIYGRWRWGFDKFTCHYETEILITHSKEGYSLYKKQRPELGDLPTKKPKTVFYKPEYSSGNGTSQIKKLFGNNIFPYPKPEELIKDILLIGSKEQDLILDFNLGSGTTLSVAHKLNRKYIGIEQMNYIEDITIQRMKKVIEGEQGGISKSVNWQGGGSFVYCELKELNQKFINDIQIAQTDNGLEDLYQSIKNNKFISYQVDINDFDKSINDFKDLSIENKKLFLFEVLDKNYLYVNYCDIDDEDFDISEEDKLFTKSFYEKR